MAETILITGASSGLGLAFVKHYASLPSPPNILALDVSPFPDLEFKTTQFHQLDISSPQALQDFARQIGPIPIRSIIHCAGIRGLVKNVVQNTPGDVAAAETLSVMDKTTMLKTFEINTWGTFNILQTLLANLQLSAKTSSTPPQVVILSSRMGSVAANTAGGGYAYRASKAALNAVVKSLSIDVPEVGFLLLHPGRVETGLVDWKEEGAISVEESLRDCLKVMEVCKGQSGKLVDRFGVEIPW